MFIDGLVAALKDRPATVMAGSSTMADAHDLPLFDTQRSVGTVGLHLGADVRPLCERNVFWPLSVGPVEPNARQILADGRLRQLSAALMRRKLDRALARSDGLIFSSQYARSRYEASFRRARRSWASIVNTGHSIEPGTPPAARAWPTTDEPIHVLWVGNAYGYKGLALAVEGFELFLKSTGREAVLDIVGRLYDDNASRRVRQVAQSTGLSIRIHGERFGAALAEMYQRSDVFLFTSLSENYGSFALADAFRFGLPTISSNRSSMPEFCEGAALAVDPVSPERIAAALAELTSSVSEYERWAAVSRKRGLVLPTWSEVADSLLRELESMP